MTEQLDKLIPPELRKTRKIKTAVRIEKPYREIIQLALEAQTDLVNSKGAQPIDYGRYRD